jgi:hypothetical protein
MEVLAKLPAAEHRDGDLKLVLKALSAFRRGEQGVTLPTEWDGLYGKIAAEFNELSSQTARSHNRLKSVVAGPHTGSARRPPPRGRQGSPGFWQENVASVNAVLDEVELVSERSAHHAGSLTELKKGNRAPSCRTTGPACSARWPDAFNDVGRPERAHVAGTGAACRAWSARKASSRSAPPCPAPSGFWRDSAESINSPDLRPGAPTSKWRA